MVEKSQNYFGLTLAEPDKYGAILARICRNLSFKEHMVKVRLLSKPIRKLVEQKIQLLCP